MARQGAVHENDRGESETGRTGNGVGGKRWRKIDEEAAAEEEEEEAAMEYGGKRERDGRTIEGEWRKHLPAAR